MPQSPTPAPSDPLVFAAISVTLRARPPDRPSLIGLAFAAAPVDNPARQTALEVLLTPERAAQLLGLLQEARRRGLVPPPPRRPVGYRDSRQPH